MKRQAEDEKKKRLPARSSRGTRIRKLIGEEAEADEAFWSQSAWNEDAEDDDYSTEEEEEDVVDADFDDEEEPDEDIHDEEEEQRTRKKTKISEKKRRVYQEPQPRAMKKAKETKPTKEFTYEAPTVRQSTARRTSESTELRKKTMQETAKTTQSTPSKPKITRLTQAQLLKEAVRTEVENTQSLNRLEQLEEEKKMESIAPKAPFTGQLVRYHSRIGMPKTITFLNTHEYPSIFQSIKPKKRRNRT